uniref:Uncharacterized protein n=1 Tax=Schlesneria paludicola TaxID=360056 RepID=A0A7C4QLC0_9PLAN
MSTAALPVRESAASSGDQSEPRTVPAAATVARGRDEWRVVGVVLAVLGLTEAVFRLGGDRLSKDVAHLQAFPRLAERLAQGRGRGPRILFLGNSLTRHGVDEAEIAAVFRERLGVQPLTLKIVPDNTAIADWYYVYRNQFTGASRAPDLLVIGFENGHLRDAPSRHVDRLAQYYCTWSDWCDLCRFDLPDWESQAVFALARCSATFGNRDRVTRRLLDTLIPGYRAGMERINASLQAAAAPLASPSYERLRKLLELAREDGVEVVLAAMPVPEDYDFDAELLSLVDQSAVQLLDLRRLETITPEMFFDGLHMDAAAAKAYSRALGHALTTVVQPAEGTAGRLKHAGGDEIVHAPPSAATGHDRTPPPHDRSPP